MTSGMKCCSFPLNSDNYDVLVCVKLSGDELEAVEDGVIETILSTVLRLPEMNFRSIKFTKVVYM